MKRRGFTLIELISVIAIMGLLAGLLLPVAGRIRDNADTTKCLSNLKQLQLCWHLYNNDYDGRLVPNKAETGIATIGRESWISGSAKNDATPDNIRASAFFPYNESVEIYRCPSDRSRTTPRRPSNRAFPIPQRAGIR